MIKYLSPSSFKMYKENRTKFYQIYLADNPIPRDPQTIHMAIGSAFDAYVKTQIMSDLGIVKFELRELFEKQVEQQHREYCWEHGKIILDAYKECGAYATLVEDLGMSQIEPHFEFKIEAEINGVPVSGFPDCFYISSKGTRVILDWKVNGYYSGKGTPNSYYLIDHQTKKPHPKVIIGGDETLPMVTNKGMENVSKDWAVQQFIYAIGLGAKVGSHFITTIDQVIGGPKFFTYRNYVGRLFQIECARELKEAWTDIQEGTVLSQDLIKDLNDPEMQDFLY